jgi:hypothetical protein
LCEAKGFAKDARQDLIDPVLQARGEVPEWSIGTVSKTVVRASVPWVRIPPSPPAFALRASRFAGLARSDIAKQDALRSLGKGGLLRMYYVYLIQSEAFPSQRYVGFTKDLRKCQRSFFTRLASLQAILEKFEIIWPLCEEITSLTILVGSKYEATFS